MKEAEDCEFKVTLGLHSDILSQKGGERGVEREKEKEREGGRKGGRKRENNYGSVKLVISCREN
jgi:hypothetical protein